MKPCAGSGSPPRERRDGTRVRLSPIPALTRRATFVLLLLALPLRAHDIYTSFAEAKLLPDRLELTLTLARACAHAFLPAEEKLPPITPDNFASVAPRLRATAPTLFQITAAGKPLDLTAPADVKVAGDTDVVFTLNYPRPTAGPLKFFAQFVGSTVDGHVCTLVLTNAAGDDLGWSPVSFDKPSFEVALPGATSAKKSPPKK